MSLDQAENVTIQSETNEQPQESYNVEISSSTTAGAKWITFVQENGPVDVKPDESTQHIWAVEKWGDESHWSFSQTVEDMKLYVTYNLENNDVRMEQENSGHKRLFTKLLQSDGGLLLRAIDGCGNRYLVRSEKGMLEMLTTDNPTEDMRWYNILKLSHSFAVAVQILNNTDSKQWLAEGNMNHPVQQVQTSKIQKWKMVPDQTSFPIIYTFGCGKYMVTSNLFFGSTCGKFYLADTSGSGVTLQDAGTKKYIYGSPKKSDLEFVSDKSSATAWEICFHSMWSESTGNDDANK